MLAWCQAHAAVLILIVEEVLALIPGSSGGVIAILIDLLKKLSPPASQ